MADLLLTLLARYALPTTLLLFLAMYHVRVVRQKDLEIKRVNEARIRDSQVATERLLGIASEFNELSSEQKSTLLLISDRLRRG